MRYWEKIVLGVWIIGCSYSALPYALGRMGEAFLVGFSFTIGSLLLFLLGYLLEGHQPIQRIRRVTDRLRRELSKPRVGRLGIALFLGGVTGLVILFIICDMSFPLALWGSSHYLVSVSEMFVYLGVVLIMLWGYIATRQRGLLFMVPFFWLSLSHPMLEALGGLQSYGIDRISEWASWQYIYSGSLSMIGVLTMILFFFGAVRLVMDLRILPVLSSVGRGRVTEKAVKPLKPVLAIVIVFLVWSSILSFSWRAGMMVMPYPMMYAESMAINIRYQLMNMDARLANMDVGSWEDGMGSAIGSKEPADWYVRFEPHRDGVRVNVYIRKMWIWAKKTVIVPLHHISLDEEITTPIVRKGTSYEFGLSTDTKSWIEKVGNKFTVYFHRHPNLFTLKSGDSK